MIESLAMALLIATPAPSVGIAPVPASVCFPDATSPGHSYAGLAISWRNTGTVTETITFTVNKSPAGSWVSAPASVILNPGQTVSVPVELNVPSDAVENASYTARIIATASSSAANGAAELRTSAGVDVGFGVGQRPDCAPAVAAVSPAVSGSVASSPSAAAKPKSSSSGLVGGVIVVALIAAALMFTRRRRHRRTTTTRRTYDDEEGNGRRYED